MEAKKGDHEMTHPDSPCRPGKPRVDLETRLYRWLGQYDGVIYTDPPGDRLYMCRTKDSVIKTGNDGSVLWIGTPDTWYWHCRFPEARKLAWFILWNWWAKSTWFGLRRWLWYRLLARQCNRIRGKA